MFAKPESKFVLSGFADEIDDDLGTQLSVLQELGIRHIDLRSVDGINILDLNDAQLADVRDNLDRYGVEIAAIGSPIGKIDITDEFEPHYKRFKHALEVAEYFDTEYVRLFSYWIPEDENPADYREVVMRRMQTKIDLAEEADITLLHENEKDIYGDTPTRCRDLVTTLDSPNFRLIFDPANFLEIGVRAYPDALLQLVEYVEYLHIKDAEFGERGAIHPAGEGDGHLPEVLEILQQRGFSGFAALEPHLSHAGKKGGYSGPEAYTVAAAALTNILDNIGAEYE